MKSKPKYELIEIARDIFHKQIFTNLHIACFDTYLIVKIFMPLALIGKKTKEQLKADPPGLIFEYYTEAVTKFSINGYPCFPSCRFINKDDGLFVIKTIEKMIDAEKQTMKDIFNDVLKKGAPDENN